MAAAGRCFNEVEDRGPAHEAMKGRIVFVEHRPEVAECLLVAGLAKGRGAASEMRRREERPAPHGPQRAFGAGNLPIEVGLAPPQASHEPGDQLTSEPKRRLVGVSRQPRCLRPRGGGD